VARIGIQHGVPLALALAIAACAGLQACDSGARNTYQGYVEGEFVHIASGVGGRLQRLLVQRGQSVEANTPLFELEGKQETAAVRQADEVLGAAGATLADLGSGKRHAEVEVSRAQLDQARASEKQSAAQVVRDEAQFEAGGISRNELEESRARHEVDAARVRELENSLEVTGLKARPAQIRSQASQVAAAQAARDQAQWRLDEKHLGATQAGVIVDTLYREGEWVPAGAPVVRMLPPGNLKIRFFVPEGGMRLFPVGREVSVRCEGCERPVVATVTYVATDPEFTPPVIYSNDQRAKLVFMVEAHPAADGAAVLRPGQPVEITAP
jgi:HlyD family secretion protein